MTQPGKDGRRITLVIRLSITMLIVFPEVTERLPSNLVSAFSFRNISWPSYCRPPMCWQSFTIRLEFHGQSVQPFNPTLLNRPLQVKESFAAHRGRYL